MECGMYFTGREEFLYYAEICFKSFGDRVKYWVTVNEPNMYIVLAYETGVMPPSRCSEPFGKCLDGNSDVEPLIAMHNMLLAHGRAAKLYHDEFQVINQVYNQTLTYVQLVHLPNFD